MSAKEFVFSIEAREQMMHGIDTLADAVGVTLGPRGRNVVLESPSGPPHSTKDGVTVANAIELAEPFENVGARLVREIAQRVHDEAGDGTTSAIVIAQALAREACNAVAVGIDPMQLRRHIEAAVRQVLDRIDQAARPVVNHADRRAIALVASNSDREVADMLAEAFAKVGTDGAIGIEAGQSADSTIEFVNGMRLDQGLLSPSFATDAEGSRCELDRPYVLLCGKALSSLPELLPILEAVAQSEVPLLIVADDIGGDVLATLIANRTRGRLKVAAIKAPAFGDQRAALMDDLAALCDTQVVRDELGLSLDKLRLDFLGRARQVRIGRSETTVIGEPANAEGVAKRGASIRQQIADAATEDAAARLRARLAGLIGSAAIIRIGGGSEGEIRERQERADDALNAMRGAVADGVVPGGGVALLQGAGALAEYDISGLEARAAVRAVRAGLAAPLRRLADNGGYSSAYVLWKVQTAGGNVGFDVNSGNYVDMMQAGIIDPTRSVHVALRSAASIASLLITTEAIVAEAVERHPNGPELRDAA
jgi:chaperonin GroEL